MASNEQEEVSIKVKLSKLHCPFTWEILDSMIKHITCYGAQNIHYEDDEYSMDKETSCSLELFIKCLYICYKYVISADDDKARKEIQKAEKILIQIQNGQEYHKTIRAIEHIFYATKCFFLYNVEQMDQLQEIENIIDIEDFNNEELGALYGCQSVIWSFFNDFGIEKAIEFAKKAIEKNHDCAMWHFILAKNLRRLRRSTQISSSATDEEKENFEIAYTMSKNHTFGIYYLQMRMERFYTFCKDKSYITNKNANEIEVLQIAKEILKTEPTNYKVLLKLALIFLRARVSDERLFAKKCLDAVKKIAPDNPTHLHYTAMLYEQSGDYKEAVKYFKKAVEYNNFVAELSYVQYGWEIGELEPLPHLLRMLKKYKQAIKERQIAMLLAIAISYYSLHNDIQNAAQYFVKALTIDPLNKKFKIYYKFLDFQTKNLSLFLNNEFCILLDRKNYREISQKIRKLLNVKNVTNLTEKFQVLSMENKKGHSNTVV